MAGLVLALTPISVAIARHNNPDALLVLCSVAALWCVVRALEDGRTRWLVLAGVAVGLGFEAKMAAALMVVPGIAAAYLWVAPRGRLAALRQLLAGGAAMVVVGGAWPALVALTPADARPWVSGTSDNSIWSLILGYNGLGRLDGQAGGPGGMGRRRRAAASSAATPASCGCSTRASAGRPAGCSASPWSAGSRSSSRAACGGATRRTGWVIATGGAFAVTAVAFSSAEGIFHPYYVSLLAPFTAALVGAGAAQLAGGGVTARVLAPAAVVAGMATELAVLGKLPGELETLAPIMAAVCVLAAATLAAVHDPRVRKAALGGRALGAADRAGDVVGADARARDERHVPGRRAGERAFARAGRVAAASAAGGGGVRRSSAGAAACSGQRRAHRRGRLRRGQRRRHAVRVEPERRRRRRAVSSGADVAALGGFSGRESEVSLDWLADRVEDGTIRWVLADGEGGGMANDGRTGSQQRHERDRGDLHAGVRRRRAVRLLGRGGAPALA